MSYAAALPFLLAGGALLVIWFILGLLAGQFNPPKWAYAVPSNWDCAFRQKA